MALPGAMDGVVWGDSLHLDVAAAVPALSDRLFKRLERELVKGKARQRAHKKAAARRMRRIISSHLAETSPTDVMEGVSAPAPQSEPEQPEELKLPGVKLAILQASKVKKHKGRKAKNSSYSPPPPLLAPPAAPAPLPSPQPTPPPLLAPPATPAPLPSPQPTPPPPQYPAAPELEWKIAHLEAELLSRDRSRQKRNDAFRSLKISEHEKMLELMDARHQIDGLVTKIHRVEVELEENKRKTVSWVRRAEKFKAERYEAFAHTIDPVTPPPPRAIEWRILARQPEFWAGVVRMVSLLAAIYAVGRLPGWQCSGGKFFPSIKIIKHLIPINKTHLIFKSTRCRYPAPSKLTCPRPPRVESPRVQLCPKVKCSRVECPRVSDCPKGSDLAPREKCRGNRHLLASYALGALMGGIRP